MKIVGLIIFIIIILLLVLGYLYLKSKNKKDEITDIEKKIVSKPTRIISKNLPPNFDFDSFEKEVKELYTNIQTAFMNFDYDYLNTHLSEKILNQYTHQLDMLKKNNKIAVRKNIYFIDFIFNDYENNIYSVNIGVYEDKYNKKKQDKDRITGITYESYYELSIIKEEELILDDLKLIYSHSKKS